MRKLLKQFRHPLYISAATLLLGGLAAFLFTNWNNSSEVFTDSNSDMNSHLRALTQEQQPLVIINFKAVYGNRIQFQVLHPALKVQRSLSDSECTNCSLNSENPFEDNNQSYEESPLLQENWEIRNKVIAQISESEIAEISTRTPLFVSKDYIFIKDSSQYRYSPLSYLVYDMRDLRAKIKDTNFEIVPYAPGKLCLQRVGNACWTYSTKHFLTNLRHYSLVIMLLVAVLLLGAAALLIRSLYYKSKEQEKHRLALQVLSHEFRTPVSSLLLMVEELAKNGQKLSTTDQDLVTRISGEVFQLQRIVEMSKTYLQTGSHKIELKQIEIPSINTWISDFATETSPEIQCQLLPRDQSIQADPFWLKYVLLNFIQNAQMHGKPPIVLRLSQADGKIKITVEDHGECEFDTLSEMSQAFTKSNRSKGMGLGLNISKSILEAFDSEIQFSKHPTAFTLSLKNENRGLSI